MELSGRLIVDFEESPVWLELVEILKLRLITILGELESGKTSRSSTEGQLVTQELYQYLRGEAASLRYILEAPKILREEIASKKPPTEEGEE